MSEFQALICSASAGLTLRAGVPAFEVGPEEGHREVVRGYADWCRHAHAECARRAEVLEECLQRFAAA